MNAKEIIKILKADGWELKNQNGSHKHFIHPTKKGKIQVPDHGHKDLKITTANQILKSAGLK